MADRPRVLQSRLDRFRYLSPDHDPAWRRLVGRVLDLRNVGWDIGVRGMERLAGHKRGDRTDFHLGASTRDILSTKGRAVRDEMEQLVDAVMKAGSYPARDEAARAVGAVFDTVRDRIPPDLVVKLSEHLPVAEAARLRRAASDRLALDERFSSTGRETARQEGC